MEQAHIPHIVPVQPYVTADTAVLHQPESRHHRYAAAENLLLPAPCAQKLHSTVHPGCPALAGVAKGGSTVQKIQLDKVEHVARLHQQQELLLRHHLAELAVAVVDIAGLVKGASKGEGLGNQFLANIREVDAIVHVVRCFEDTNVIHVDGSVDPLRDIETINFELIFSDIEVLDRRISKSARAAHNDKKIAAEVEFLKKVKAHLEDGQLAKTFVTEDEDEQALLNECNLLTAKPVIFAANVSEDDLADDGAENDYVQKVREYAKSCEAEVFVVCAQIEQEIAELDDDEKAMFLEDLGLKESGLEKLIKASYSLLGLISYLTAGPIESKAWTITRGTKAPQAAGKIHSDFERGFIKADVISYEDLIANGSMTAARDKGLVRSEGKEYVMQDGDVVLFKFNV